MRLTDEASPFQTKGPKHDKEFEMVCSTAARLSQLTEANGDYLRSGFT